MPLNHNSISVVAVDLDDTLIQHDWTISDRTMQALQDWADQCGPVIIATGRPPRWTRRIPDELHDFPWVCYNGAVAYDQGEEIHRDLISVDVTQRFVEAFLSQINEGRIGLEIDDIHYGNQHIPERPDIQYIEDLRSVAHQPAAKILLSIENYHQLQPHLADVMPQFKALISERVGMVQVMAPQASKGAALDIVVQRYGFSMQNIVAFGDDVNDIEMIRDSGLGVAMGNAVPELKAVADRLTGTNNENGVATVLEEFLHARLKENRT